MELNLKIGSLETQQQPQRQKQEQDHSLDSSLVHFKTFLEAKKRIEQSPLRSLFQKAAPEKNVA